MLDFGLQGKKALITGGGTGIGRAIAVALAREGVSVAIASRNPDPKVIEEIESYGAKGLRLVVDVSKEDQVVKMVEDAIEGLGGLDIYVNNAAAHWDEPVTKVTSDGWMNSINTNLSACVWACRETSKHFIAQKNGSILIVGSVATWNPLPRETGYRVSKSGLVAYMGVLAVELAPFGIRVNMLTPGFFPTAVSAHLGKEMMKQVLDGIPLRRAGNPEELTWPAMLLLSGTRSGFTTGAEWVVDGGQTLRPLPFYSDEDLERMNESPAVKASSALATAGGNGEHVSKKLNVINVPSVVGFSPPDAAGKYESRLLIDGESVGSSNLVLNHFTLYPGESTYAGSHPTPYEEVYYILGGVGELVLGGPDGERHRVSSNTVAYIPSGMVHQIANVGREPLEMLTMMPFHPKPGANTLYDERKRQWGTSFRQVAGAASEGK